MDVATPHGVDQLFAAVGLPRARPAVQRGPHVRVDHGGLFALEVVQSAHEGVGVPHVVPVTYRLDLLGGPNAVAPHPLGDLSEVAFPPPRQHAGHVGRGLGGDRG